MDIRDRIIAFKRVRAGDLIPDDDNPRVHSEQQRRGLRFMLESVGLVGAVLVREADKGKYKLIDGHLRADFAPDLKLPTLVTDLNEREARQVMATFDAVGAMAGYDKEKLNKQLAFFDSEGNPAVHQFLDAVRDVTGTADKDTHFDSTKLDDSVEAGDVKTTYIIYASFKSPDAFREAVHLLECGSNRGFPEGSTMASIDGDKHLATWRERLSAVTNAAG